MVHSKCSHPLIVKYYQSASPHTVTTYVYLHHVRLLPNFTIVGVTTTAVIQNQHLTLQPSPSACRVVRLFHSGLKIPVNKRAGAGADGSELTFAALKDLQERFEGVEYMLVDEMTVVGQDLLGLMSIRGRQAVSGRTPHGNDGRERGLFGGLSVILVGDPMQLPPVGAAPMWSDRPGTAGHSVEGRAAWLGLNAAVELTEVMRQMGDAQAAFRRALIAVAEGRAMQEHFDLFRTRMRSQVPETDQATFTDAVHLFPTNKEADDWNWERLNLLGTEIALVVASHTVSGYTNVSAERFRNLAPNLYLAVGARIFINNNVWTSAGLANGAAGEIVHMQWG